MSYSEGVSEQIDADESDSQSDYSQSDFHLTPHTFEYDNDRTKELFLGGRPAHYCHSLSLSLQNNPVTSYLSHDDNVTVVSHVVINQLPCFFVKNAVELYPLQTIRNRARYDKFCCCKMEETEKKKQQLLSRREKRAAGQKRKRQQQRSQPVEVEALVNIPVKVVDFILKMPAGEVAYDGRTKSIFITLAANWTLPDNIKDGK